ncbi:MAG: NAD(P)-dependent oxidoreductase [Ruminococcus sp.]|nr:NAD(P)-dependent oxidoreductase [Ruminococcus sp.]
MNLDRPLTVAVTGASGFLGTYITASLHRTGHNVVALGREQKRLRMFDNIGIKTEWWDLRYADNFDLSGADVVIHTAGMTSMWGSLRDYMRFNNDLTDVLIQRCIKDKVKKLIYISSAEVYTDNNDRFDVAENDYVVENNFSYFAQSKIKAENLLRQYAGNYMDIIVLRPTDIIGQWDTKFLCNLVELSENGGIPIFKNGSNLINPCGIENFVRAVELIVDAPLTSTKEFKVYNICGEASWKFKNFVDKAFYYMGEVPHYKREMSFNKSLKTAEANERTAFTQDAPEIPRVTQRWLCKYGVSLTLDSSKIRREILYKPVRPMDATLRDFANWYKQYKNSDIHFMESRTIK